MGMKIKSAIIFATVLLTACNPKQDESTDAARAVEIQGTWKLISGTLIEKGDTTVTDYTEGLSMIKILNASHFAFLNHDLNKGKDSTASFVAGGGTYTLDGNQYTENLEYCSAREWEGNSFHFTVEITGDTLVQQGIEKLVDLGIERLNTERYVRMVESPE